MPDRDTFLRTILAQPAEDGPRLVYADWLEEQGEADRAEFIRVQVRIAELEAGLPPMVEFPLTGTECAVRDGVAEIMFPATNDRLRALLPESRSGINVLRAGIWFSGAAAQVMPVTMPDPAVRSLWRPRPDITAVVVRLTSYTCGVDGPGHRRAEHTRCRQKERELLRAYGSAWLNDLWPAEWMWDESGEWYEAWEADGDGVYGVAHGVGYGCGFPSILDIPWEGWRTRHDAIRSAVPVRTVDLTTRPEFFDMASGDFTITGRYVAAMEEPSSVPMAGDWMAAVIQSLLRAEWPGIDFHIPPPANSALGGRFVGPRILVRRSGP